MLTFFEYLRQRAFESVMSGAEEALEMLSRDKTFEVEKATGPRAQTQTHLALGRETEQAVVGKMTPPPVSSNLPANTASVPAPRRRGRPKKKAASER